MGRLRYNVATSLDGFIARRDGSYDWIVEDSAIDFNAIFAQFDAFIMGRKTFETMLAQGDQNPLKVKPKDRLAVVTTKAVAADSSSEPSDDFVRVHGESVTLLGSKEEAIAWIREAKARFDRDIWLFGGAVLCGSLLQEKGIVDTVEAAIMPVVLGDGIKMVEVEGGGEAGSTWALRLMETERLPQSGILMCKYEVVYS